jgi:hypothetical protein
MLHSRCLSSCLFHPHNSKSPGYRSMVRHPENRLQHPGTIRLTDAIRTGTLQ